MISGTGALTFSAPQRELVFKALNEAEECTADYYCIPPFRWEQLHYDLLTRDDHEWEPIPDPMLARVRRLERTDPRKSFNFYRIELNDPSILSAAERENLLRSSELYPFLVYILTHEIVHLVRLNTIHDNRADVGDTHYEAEESRVQDVAGRILSRYSILLPALERFCTPRATPKSSETPKTL